jgi:hypothetical protein
MEKTIPAADGRAKAILATVHLALTLAKVTVCLTQGLLLEEDCKVLMTKVKPGGE